MVGPTAYSSKYRIVVFYPVLKCREDGKTDTLVVLKLLDLLFLMLNIDGADEEIKANDVPESVKHSQTQFDVSALLLLLL